MIARLSVACAITSALTLLVVLIPISSQLVVAVVITGYALHRTIPLVATLVSTFGAACVFNGIFEAFATVRIMVNILDCVYYACLARVAYRYFGYCRV